MRKTTCIGIMVWFLCPLLFAVIPGNLELARLQEEVNQAILDIRDAKASRWPTIELEANGTYMSNPLIGPITVPAGTFSSPPPIPPSDLTLYEGMESTLYKLGVTITQPIFTWGKINASVKAQEAIAEAKSQELINREQELSTEIATRAGALQELRAIDELLKKQHAMGEELLALSYEVVRSGMLLEVEQAEMELHLQEIELALLDSAYAIAEQERKLKQLTSIQDFTAYQYNEEAVLEMFGKPVETLVAQALSPRHASLGAIAAMHRATQAAEDLARGSFYGKPDLALVVSAGYNGAKFPLVESDWNVQDNYDFTISVGLKSTIFDGGKISNTIKRAESQEYSATLELQEAKQLIANEVEETYLLLGTTLEKLDLERRKQETLARRIETNTKLYQSGYGERSQVIQAEMSLLTSQITEYQQKIDAWEAYQKLRFLSGF